MTGVVGIITILVVTMMIDDHDHDQQTGGRGTQVQIHSTFTTTFKFQSYIPQLAASTEVK